MVPSRGRLRLHSTTPTRRTIGRPNPLRTTALPASSKMAGLGKSDILAGTVQHALGDLASLRAALRKDRIQLLLVFARGKVLLPVGADFRVDGFESGLLDFAIAHAAGPIALRPVCLGFRGSELPEDLEYVAGVRILHVFHGLGIRNDAHDGFPQIF